MPPERIAELRRLLELDNSVTLSAKDLTWLLDIHDQMKTALRGLFETHVAIDPPESKGRSWIFVPKVRAGLTPALQS
ncbi:MAG: hypothetical protein QOG61_605 [Candidatus Binataceae bacterium]|nr:hypothetical protein [Candidatus Binataceae bacterium]